MYKYDDIERILKKISEENPREMEEIDEIDNSVFARIEAKVLTKLSKTKKQKKMKLRFYLRAAAAAFGIIAVFSVAFYLIDLPATRASKDPVNGDAYDELSQEELNEIAVTVKMPGYIPEGYVVDADFVSDGDYLAEYKYINSSDESLFILVTIDSDLLRVPPEAQFIDQQENGEFPLTFLKESGNPDINYVNFVDGNGHGVQIASTLDYDTIMKIVVSME